MTRNDYNGWTNYETWLVALWLDSEPWSNEYLRELANDDADAPAWELGDTLKDWTNETFLADAPSGGLAADLLKSALSEVNWSEIIESRKDSE